MTEVKDRIELGLSSWRSPARPRVAQILLPAVMVALLGACSADLASVERGQATAERWCSECHRVTVDQPSGSRVGHILPPPVQAPSFMAIVARPGTNADTLRHFMAELHLPMPIYRLTDDEQNDVIRYILSLRTTTP